MKTLDNVLGLSALEMAGLVRRGEVSPVELVEAHIARIEATGPSLNALVVPRFAEARAEARAAEARVQQGAPLPPLHGVPCTVKELISVAGLPITIGSLHRRERRAAADASVVARLRAAGAIVLGLTNQPEMAFAIECDNLIYGRTNNPYDLSRTPGGSSGGEGAIIAAGGSPFGLGSDAGGSVRIPAAFCGICGHKPSAGLVPLTGHYPLDDLQPGRPVPRKSRGIVIGPLARRAADLFPLLQLIAGPDGIDLDVGEHPLGDPARIDMRGRRVLLYADPKMRMAGRVRPDLRAAAHRAAQVLRERGATVELWDHPSLNRAVEIWGSTLSAESTQSLRQAIGDGTPPRLFRELLRHVVGRPRYTLAALEYCAGEALVSPGPEAQAHLVAEGQALGRHLSAELGPGNVLIMPPHPRVAPRHRSTLWRPLDAAYTAIWNALGLPATVVPMGLSPSGLPLAVQIVGGPLRDDVTIAAAMAIEEATGGWTPPPAR